MTEQEVYDLFINAGAIVKGHFEYKSGRHGKIYLAKKRVMTEGFLPLLANYMVKSIDVSVLDQIDIVAGPHTGGFMLAEHVAMEISAYWRRKTGEIKWLPVIGGIKSQNGFVLDSFSCDPQMKKVLLVDDVLTTGSTLNLFVIVLRSVGAIPVSAVVLWNRGDIDVKMLGLLKLYSLINKKIDSWVVEDCPLCEQGIVLDIKPE